MSQKSAGGGFGTGIGRQARRLRNRVSRSGADETYHAGAGMVRNPHIILSILFQPVNQWLI
jgi:hypothetical protein